MWTRGAIIWLILWTFLTWHASPEIYFRDGSEFVLVAYFRDIAHPAGYPTYSQLANLFTLLPFGSIPWRVHLFSAWCGATSLTLLWSISALLLSHRWKLSERASQFLALSTILIPLLSPSCVRQLLTAEVYGLHALFFTLLLFLFVVYQKTSDARFIIFGGFIGGLGLGNHVALLAPLGIALITLWAVYRTRFPLHACLFAGICGLLVYTSLPFRAESPLPLRTGTPYSLSRFVNLVSDARDRSLKNTDSITTHTPRFRIPQTIRTFGRDTVRLAEEFTYFLMVISFCGLIALLMHSSTIAILLLSSMISSLVFFGGWQPDPWLIPFFVIGIGYSCALGAFIAFIQKGILKELTLCAAFLPLFIGKIDDAYATARTLAHYDIARRSSEALLQLAPAQGVIITESSWFPFSYLSAIEKMRSDVTLLYQPRLLFPHYFETVSLDYKNKTLFSTQSLESTPSTEPSVTTLFEALRTIAPITPLCIEPSIVLNSYFKETFILDRSGCPSLSPGTAHTFDGKYKIVRTNVYRILRNELLIVPQRLKDDILSTLEGYLANEAHLLHEVQHPEESVALYKELCVPYENMLCSPQVEENLKKLHAERYPEYIR